MSDKPDDNIELIFRTALGASDVEPSDHFWNSSYEGIIQRTNKVYTKSVNSWKVVVGILTATVVVLSYSHFVLNDKVNNLEKRVELVEKTQNTNPVQNVVSNNNVIASHSNNEINRPPSPARTDNSIISKNTTPHQVQNTLQPTARKKSWQNVTAIVNANNNVTGFNSSTFVAQNNNKRANVNLPNITKNDVNPTYISQIYMQSSNNGSIGHTANKDSVSGPATILAPAIVKVDTVPPAKENVTDTTGSSAGFINPPIISTSPKVSFLSKTYVSAFFAPHIITGNTFTDNNSNDNVTVNDIKNNDNDYFGYTLGVRVGYDISQRLSVYTGCSYTGSSFSIQPSIVYATQQGDGPVEFPVVTSSGVVNFNPGTQTKAGDSIKVHGTSFRNYMSIPLQLKYEFYRKMKFDFYATLGGAMEIVSYKGTEIHWENTMFQEGDVSVGDIQGLKETHFSYVIGVGARYHLYKGLSVFGEPYFQSSLDAINSNTPISTYSLFLGIAGGLNYHF